MNNSMKTIKMESISTNNQAINYRNIFCNYTIPSFSLLLVLLFLSLSLIVTQSTSAAVDIDTSGDGRAAAFDGEEGIGTDGNSFCSITDDIAGGKFSSLFEGIVGECDNSQISNQFLVEYSYTKNPVKIGDKTYLTITVKDKETGNPISNAFLTLDIKPTSSSSTVFETSTVGAAVAAAGISSNQEVEQDKATQTMYTDNDGRATFTVQIGPKSDLGTYDTELEVAKDSYQSSFQQTNLRVT
jgi:hypothetical protein